MRADFFGDGDAIAAMSKVKSLTLLVEENSFYFYKRKSKALSSA